MAPLPNTALTEREIKIIEYLATGLRHRQIASRMNLSVQAIQFSGATINRKMGCKTAPESLAKYAMGQAYRNAAAQVLSGKIRNPLGEAEEHVNHVLEGIAALLRDWADQRVPK